MSFEQNEIIDLDWVHVPEHMLADPSIQFLVKARSVSAETVVSANNTLKRMIAENDPGAAQAMLQSLTPTQSKVLDYIVKQYKGAGMSPTSDEIRNQMGWSSNNSAVMAINALIKKGYVQKERGKWRSVIPVFNSKRKKV